MPRTAHRISLTIQLLTAAFFALLPCTTSAFGQGGPPQLISLQDYINQNAVEKDPVALGYIANRCSALYAVFTKGVEGETDPERKKAYAEWTQTAEDFMGKATRMMMTGTKMTLEDALAREKNIIVK
jgi:hypothetical protein